MADKRMFSKKIIESDAFLEMPPRSQNLYIHLCMNADDDGFVNNVRSIQQLCNTNKKDFQILLDKRFVLQFESGVVVIKHWKMQNYIPPDRKKETDYKDELEKLSTKPNRAYTMSTNDNAGKDKRQFNRFPKRDNEYDSFIEEMGR